MEDARKIENAKGEGVQFSAGNRKPVLEAIAVPSFIVVFLLTATLSVVPAAAQVVTGTLGSPSATTTVRCLC
jgi:hypothetical protein